MLKSTTRLSLHLPSLLLAVVLGSDAVADSALVATDLRCEYLRDPLGMDTAKPRLSWRLDSERRGQRQTAWEILVASEARLLELDDGDLWSSGKTVGDDTLHIVYGGRPLGSGQTCHWKVRVWDRDGQASAWSEPARWSMGLLESQDWTARFISYRDTMPLHRDRRRLHLPAARYYRKEFELARTIRRATVYSSALGIYDLHINGERVNERYFAPGWSDYRKRLYYNTFDVTDRLREGANAIGAVVADGWYSGYVGYGLLVGYGPDRVGRYFYGKTPALIVQLEIEYTDGSRLTVVSDTSWKLTAEGPIREADLLMGEAYDARREMPGWDRPGFDDGGWEAAILATDNGSTKAVFHDRAGEREVELGFVRPAIFQAYPGPPILPTQEIECVELMEPEEGVFIFDLGQNFAGVIRLRVQGAAGTRLRIRYGEMLHADGRLMTENLRRARATDYYTLRGDPAGETWSPRCTYHGFRYVELTGLPRRPDPSTVTGIVVHSDTPLTSSFECSDDVVNQLFRNITWTQRANFVEVPTDCPQRDERLGWMGDAQVYIRAATYNADVAAFFTKWLDDVEEAQRSFGAYPDYAPYPMQHGGGGKSFAAGWMDAGVICPWTIYRVYEDTRVIERHYESLTRFMDFRRAISPGHLGVAIGNGWGDWLSLGESTPVEYVDACYFALSTRCMAEMAAAIGREHDARNYREVLAGIGAAFAKEYVKPDGTLTVETQTAYVLALDSGLLPGPLRRPAADHLAGMIETNGGRMATGFLGTRSLLSVLSAHGHHELAVRLLQSREFPSWGYEVINGATTVWERWDSYTREDGFGRHNAAMNSFSHYAFGAVCDWMFRVLAGIDTESRGYGRILIRPGPVDDDSNPDREPVHWVKAAYASARGRIVSAWRREGERFELEITIPANTTASVHLPAGDTGTITEGGRPLAGADEVRLLGHDGERAVLEIGSGTYRFVSTAP